ncbi:hypothetical protein EJ08DRAFT_731709 [Tothia fuscella]|uniref:Uncharacterized protein n=1 Tax=Tothia fuscella TaxID=1048955 RepID=A0A9P4U0A8_9PEZI|nr:hypothetical protein EJ08DRAFT_731709 [Tothia fuscella]
MQFSRTILAVIATVASLISTTLAAPTKDTTFSGSIVPANATEHALALSSRQLGGAADFCRDTNFRNCMKNFLFGSNSCYNLKGWEAANGLSSIGFAGAMWCDTWDRNDCPQFDNGVDGTKHWSVAIDDMGKFGWNDRARSFRCNRVN